MVTKEWQGVRSPPLRPGNEGSLAALKKAQQQKEKEKKRGFCQYGRQMEISNEKERNSCRILISFFCMT